MNLATTRHGTTNRTQIPSGRGALTRRRRARRVRGATVSDRSSVRLACGSEDDPSWRMQAPIGLGIVPGGDETSALPPISLAGASGRARQKPSATNEVPRPDVISEADHEARGITEIISKGRPQRCARRNRISRANKLGAAIPYARLRTCDAASSACNTGNGSVAKPRREIRKSSLRWEWVGPLSTGVLKRGAIRVLIGQSACLERLRSVSRGSGVEIGSTISRCCGRLPQGLTQTNKG